MNTLAPYSPPTDYSPIERADLSPKTKHQYKRALQLMQESGVNPFDFDMLSSYASTLPTSARAFLKAALALMLSDLLIRAQAGATVANLDKIQVLWHRVQAMNQAIKVHQPKGTRVHVWLSNEQVIEIMTKPNCTTIEGRRSWIVLGLLFGSGLRRSELCALTFSNLKQQPKADGTMRDVIEVLHGKGDRARIIPIQPHLAQKIREWQLEAGGEMVARALHRSSKILPALSPSGVYNIVKYYGNLIGVELSPHDCRRTLNRIAYQRNKDLLQLKEINGHSSVKTTETYIGNVLDLEETPSDYISLE